MTEAESSVSASPDEQSGDDSEHHDLKVVDVPDASRFELHLADERVGLADYSISGDVVTVPHVETDPVHQGKGYAAVLMAGVLDSVRSNAQTIRPLCPYAAAYMRRHPDTQDLLATGSTV